MENEVIVESCSPVCNIQAFVEKSDKNYYFYLWIDPENSGDIKGMDYLLFLNARMLPGSVSPEYDDFMDEKVNLLWVKPITAAEQKLIADNGVQEYLKDKDLTTVHILG